MAGATGQFGEFLRVTETLGLPRDACIDPRTEMLYAEGLDACAHCPCKPTCNVALDSGLMNFSTLASICPNTGLIVSLLHGRPLRA